MQYITVEIGALYLNSQLRVLLKEHQGTVRKNEYIVQAYQNNQWIGKDKSYIKNFDIDMLSINRWLDNFISSEEIKNILNLE